MSTIRPAKSADFLRNMSLQSAEMSPERIPDQICPTPLPGLLAPLASQASRTRAGLKHIGAYLDRETVEKVAVLRARLGLDNSKLIKLAIEDLYRKQTARRAFGDT
jgi:Ribbon-helix-helix protein, copG family